MGVRLKTVSVLLKKFTLESGKIQTLILIITFILRKQLLPSTGFVVGIKLDFVSPIQKSQQSTDFIYMLKQIDVNFKDILNH